MLKIQRKFIISRQKENILVDLSNKKTKENNEKSKASENWGDG